MPYHIHIHTCFIPGMADRSCQSGLLETNRGILFSVCSFRMMEEEEDHDDDDEQGGDEQERGVVRNNGGGSSRDRSHSSSGRVNHSSRGSSSSSSSRNSVRNNNQRSSNSGPSPSSSSSAFPADAPSGCSMVKLYAYISHGVMITYEVKLHSQQHQHQPSQQQEQKHQQQQHRMHGIGSNSSRRVRKGAVQGVLQGILAHCVVREEYEHDEGPLQSQKSQSATRSQSQRTLLQPQPQPQTIASLETQSSQAPSSSSSLPPANALEQSYQHHGPGMLICDLLEHTLLLQQPLMSLCYRGIGHYKVPSQSHHTMSPTIFPRFSYINPS